MRARCPQSTLLILLCSVSDTLSGFGGSPLVSLVLCLLHLFTPQKHSQIYYPPLSLFLYFSLSVDLSYLLLTSLDLSFQISSCVVVRWCACRQPALVSSSAGDRIEFLSQPSSQPSFFFPENPEHIPFLVGYSIISVLLIKRIVE